MKEEWNIIMLLEEIFDLPINSADEIGDNELFKIKYERIVALLKAFGLYEETKEFNICNFSSGKFIQKLDNEIVSGILQELIDLSERNINILNMDKYSVLREIFRDMFLYRKELRSVINYYHRYIEAGIGVSISYKIILKLSINDLVLQARKIDEIMAKIIGEKEPVSKTELIEKYGFPNITEDELFDMEIDNL
jgi:hypothetical protein